MAAADIATLEQRYEIVGFLDDVNRNRRGESFCRTRVLGGREQLNSLAQEGVRHVFIAIGDCGARLLTAELVLQGGFKLATLIHPAAIIAKDAEIGPGTLVAAGAVIGPGAKVGSNVIVNTGTTVDHQCLLNDGVHLSPGVHLGGQVEIGRGTWVGIGANVKDKVVIGSNAIIGAGSLVLKNVPDGVTAYGVPAEVVTGRRSGESA